MFALICSHNLHWRILQALHIWENAYFYRNVTAHNSRCIGVAIDAEPTLQPPFHSLPMCAAANPQWDLVSNKCWRLWGGGKEETSFFSVIFPLAMCGDGSVHNFIWGKWKVVVAQNWIVLGFWNGDQHHKVLAIAYFYEFPVFRFGGARMVSFCPDRAPDSDKWLRRARSLVEEDILFASGIN